MNFSAPFSLLPFLKPDLKSPPPPSPFQAIDLLAVDSNHRGLGTGALLIKHCFNSVSSLLSSTSSSSLPFFLCATPLAVPLYKKLGFKSLNDPKENTELSEEEKRWAPTAMIVE